MEAQTQSVKIGRYVIKSAIVEPGTSESDTICKCLDGYELPKDKMGKVDLDANHCVPICWRMS